ncbi:hypothetical protein CUMW_202570 [Citrus unshiu]|uniref:Uncharacterized protein n=1 Tax=Citrus unshiu TaxID=55188 RepID=A0A2H5Q7B1_CITUN|nr:hypothetical protein CUMW_202570 [Citrus unshiu]
MLNLLMGFLSPQIDLEYSDGPTLPTHGSDEFRPFVRCLLDAFDVHVFWPILLFYWLTLFTLTMRRQIMHMIKYRYVPFSFVKQRYDGKMPSSSDAMSTDDWGGACYIHIVLFFFG